MQYFSFNFLCLFKLAEKRAKNGRNANKMRQMMKSVQDKRRKIAECKLHNIFFCEFYFWLLSFHQENFHQVLEKKITMP